MLLINLSLQNIFRNKNPFFQDWLNEFAIPSDPEPVARVLESSLDHRLLNFLAKNRGRKGRQVQRSKGRHYNYPESIDSSNVDFEEDNDYMQIDEKVKTQFYRTLVAEWVNASINH